MGRYGLKIKPSSTRKYDYDKCLGSLAIGTSTILPETYELDMRKFCEIKNQYLINSCVAFACSLVGECENYKRTGYKEEISTGNTYGNDACRKGYMGPGMYIDDALTGLTKIGFVPNVLFNINEEMPKVYNMLKGRQDLFESGQQLKPTAFASLKKSSQKEKNIQSMKEAILNYQCPLIIVSYDFFKEPHCVVIYGWDENNNFKYQNSWGEEDGIGYIPYKEIQDAYILFFDELTMPFEDVSPDDWFYQPLKNMYYSDLIDGVDSKFFLPFECMKRGDAIILMEKILNKFKNSLDSYFKTKKTQGYSVTYLPINTKNNNCKFNDIKETDYYYNAIDHISNLNLIKGDEKNNFNPEEYITRAQFITIMVRLYEFLLKTIDDIAEWISLSSDFGYDNCPLKQYQDINKEDWYFEYVNKATKLGLIEGYSDNNLYPNNNINRAEITVIIERLCQKIDIILKKCAN